MLSHNFNKLYSEIDTNNSELINHTACNKVTQNVSGWSLKINENSLMHASILYFFKSLYKTS